VTDFSAEQVGRMFSERHREAIADLGRFNLAVFGKTGTGKSTLVNAIFGADVAPTGTGAPVTEGLDYYHQPNTVLGLYDSRGFEIGEAGDKVLAELTAIVADSRTKPMAEQIHAAWYTLRWSDRRFESQQVAFVQRLCELMPVIVVLTQVPANLAGQKHQDAVQLSRYIESLQLPLSPENRVIMTNARADEFTGSPVHGLPELLEATSQTAPEAARRALTAAQLIDRERKRRDAAAVIGASAGSAAATGLTPIPFSDAAILVPIQIGMIAKISASYGVRLPEGKLASLVASIFLAGGATTAGRWLVASLLRVVPGGQVPAMVISGAVAGGLTTAMGWAWVSVCERLLESPEDLDEESIKALFVEEFRRRFRASALTRTDQTPPQ
jgi:uncharacterized protein (DUF697 family)/predicted GTPase